MIETCSSAISTTGWSGTKTVFAIPTITPTGLSATDAPIFMLAVNPVLTWSLSAAADGSTVWSVFNVLGQQSESIQPDPTYGTAGAGPTTTWTFDVFGGVLTQVNPQPGGATVDTTTTNGYDGFHRLSTVTTDPNSTDDIATESTTAYGYNLANEMTSLTDPDLNETVYSYYTNGQLETTTDPTGATQTDTYTMAGATSPPWSIGLAGEIEYAYDNLGRGSLRRFGLAAARMARSNFGDRHPIRFAGECQRRVCRSLTTAAATRSAIPTSTII